MSESEITTTINNNENILDENKQINEIITTTTTTDNITNNNDDNKIENQEVQLTKGQLKRKLKEERWNQVKVQRKEFLKQKKKELKKRKHQEMTKEQKLEKNMKKQKKKRDPSTIEYSGNIILDMEMADVMNEKEQKSTANQVCYLYGANSKADRPLKINITGYKGKIKQVIETLNGVPNWKLEKHEETYLDLYKDEKDNLVYLTSDSPNTIESLDPTKHYIIGTFVDHNKMKGYTYKKATEQGIATAKLPIGDFITLSSRKVLAINHVFEILLDYIHNKDWKAAFEKVIPQRKLTKEEEEEEENEKLNEITTTTTSTSTSLTSDIINVEKKDD